MVQNQRDISPRGRCSHEFSRPRQAVDGELYQVCLLCAAEYKYDRATKRWTEGVVHNAAENHAPENPRARRRSPRRPAWAPRARRIKMGSPVRYRVKNLGTWNEGTIENLSQSGVLLRGAQRFPENTLVEMVFEMPEEISGQKNSKVLCQVRIIRIETGNELNHHEFAASILDYKFIQ